MFFEPVLILVMFLLRVRRSEALTKSGSRRPSSTSRFLALLLTSTDFVMSQSVASAISAGPDVARSSIVNIPASFSFCLVTAPTPAIVVTSSSSSTASSSTFSSSTISFFLPG